MGFKNYLKNLLSVFTKHFTDVRFLVLAIIAVSLIAVGDTKGFPVLKSLPMAVGMMVLLASVAIWLMNVLSNESENDPDIAVSNDPKAVALVFLARVVMFSVILICITIWLK